MNDQEKPVEDPKAGIAENVQEVLPEVSQIDLTRPIDPLKKSKKELEKIERLRVIEQKKYYKRRMRNKFAKAARKRNRKNK